MTDVVIAGSESNTVANTIEVFYTSPLTAGTTITAFSAVNNSSADASYKAYIFDATGAALNPVVPVKIVVRNRFDIAPSITNQFIPAGGSLRIETSAIGAIDFRVSGVVL